MPRNPKLPGTYVGKAIYQALRYRMEDREAKRRYVDYKNPCMKPPPRPGYCRECGFRKAPKGKNFCGRTCFVKYSLKDWHTF
jgi:hypothetical protein